MPNAALAQLGRPAFRRWHRDGCVDVGKIELRGYINATIGFEELTSITNKPPNGLMRMFGSAGNPHARNLFEIISRI